MGEGRKFKLLQTKNWFKARREGKAWTEIKGLSWKFREEDRTQRRHLEKESRADMSGR